MSIPWALYIYRIYSLFPFIISTMDLSCSSGIDLMRSEFYFTNFAFSSGAIVFRVSGVIRVGAPPGPGEEEVGGAD